MFFQLSKLLPPLLYPIGFAVGILLLVLVLRHRRWRTALTAIACIVLGVAGNRLFSMTLVRSLEWRIATLQQTDRIRADAIVVLGGGTREGRAPRPFHEVGEAGDRVIYAAKLYRAGVAPVVLVSGGYGPVDTSAEAEVMAELLVFFGVPREAILLERASRNTYENGVESERVLAAHGLSEIVLVTSALHMPRAHAVFRKRNLEVTAAPTDFLVTESDWRHYTQLHPGIQVANVLPKAEYMELTEKAMKELLGILVYRLRGWL